MGEVTSTVARNVVVDHTSDDSALRGSKVSNLTSHIASRRLGHTGPIDIDRAGKTVFAIDCDDFNITCDKPVEHITRLERELAKLVISGATKLKAVLMRLLEASIPKPRIIIELCVEP